MTERRLAEEALAAANQRYIEAQEQERSRLARELHDDINQRIGLLAFNLDRVKNDLPVEQAKLRERVAGECERVSQLASDIQALSHRLHSSKLEYLGLEVAAKGFCAEVTELENVEVDFRSHDVTKELSKETSLSLFRVLQEALQNALKHSGSKKFQVVLSGSSNQLELTVRDWGTGFTVEDKIKGRGLGLTSMRERMKLAGGQLSIQSEPGAGTTICATVPLHAMTTEPSRNTALKAVNSSA
jgi:signal transduction histidine kinase